MNRERKPGGPLPDFIIGGAMKSATTTLHRLLDSLDEIHVPGDEIRFFNLDDFLEQPVFFPRTEEGWVDHDWEEKFDEYFEWYQKQFDGAEPNQILGEVSSTYLASPAVPRRLHDVNPDVRLIFLLRDPVDRAYSQYWHYLRNGFVTRPFERVLETTPSLLLSRSLYARGLKRFRKYFPRERIRVLLFEEFVEDVQGHVEDVLDFLGCEASLDVREHETHVHRAKNARSVRLQLWINWAFQVFYRERYRGQIPDTPRKNTHPIRKALYRLLCSLNLTRSSRPPDMDPDTRAFLESVLTRENRDLPGLIDPDPASAWPWFEKTR